MTEKIVTIGTLLDRGLINKKTKVRVSVGTLRELRLIKPIPKEKIQAITSNQLIKSGMIKK